MKLCIIICVSSIPVFGTAFPLSHYDVDLAERDGIPVPSLRIRENQNKGRRPSLDLSNEGSRVLIGDESSGESFLDRDMGTSDSQKLTVQASTNLESRDDQEEQTTATNGAGKKHRRDLNAVTRHRLYIHSTNTRGGHNEASPIMNSKLEARGREARQGKATNGYRGRISQSSSVSSSPFGSPRAQAGSSIGSQSIASFGRWSAPNDIGGSGELIGGHLPSEPSQLSRENSFEHVTPTVETNTKPKTSRSTKLYRGVGVGAHYVRSNPKEAGLVALSAFGQAASVGALGPLVYGNKGVGMAVAGVGALSNFLAYSGQAATNVKKWQKTEAKIPKEKQGEPLDPWIDATKAFADRSSRLTGAVSKSAVKPFQIAGGQLKKVVPGRMKKVQSEPNIWREDIERRSEELEEDKYHQDAGTLATRALLQQETRKLQARNLDAVVLNEDNSAILQRRGTPPGRSGERKASPPKNPPPGSTNVSTPSPREKSPQNKSPPRVTSIPGSVSMSTSQSRDKLPSRQAQSRTAGGVQSTTQSKTKPFLDSTKPLPPTPPEYGGRRSFDRPTRSRIISSARSRSASPIDSGMRRKTNSLASILQPSPELTSASTLDKGRSDSPVPEARARGRFTVTQTMLKRPTSLNKSPSGEFQPPKSTFQEPLSTTSGSRSSISPPKRSGVKELAELDNLLSTDWAATKDLPSTTGAPRNQPSSPRQSTSSLKTADSEEMHSPKSAFHAEGFSVPAWAGDVRSSSPLHQTKSQALAELQEQEGSKRSAGPVRKKQPIRMVQMPLMTKMRQGALASPPPPLILTKQGSGGSSRSSPFGSPEYQSRPPMEVPYRDFSRDWPQGELPTVAPALPKPPPSPS